MSTNTPRRWRAWAGAACAAALVAAPAAAHADSLPTGPVASTPASAGELTLTDSSEALAPGITLRHLKALTPDQGWVDLRELLVDLTQPNIRPDVVTNATVPQRSVLTTTLANTGATAVINGDFFDINGTGAGEGLELKDGDLLKGTVADSHSYLTFDQDDDLAKIESLAVDAEVTFGSPSAAHRVVTFNDPGDVDATAPNGLPADSIVAYTPDWGSGSRSGAPTTPAIDAEVLVTDGRVVSVTSDTAAATAAAAGGAIPANSFYLEGRGTEGTALAALNVGDPVDFTHTVSDAMGSDLRSALGGRQLLVHNGVPDNAADLGDDGDAPRTAVGIRDGGRTMMIVVADGRQTAVVGPTRASMAQIMASLGADEAVNFDGGASTEMVARHLGDTTGSMINFTSTGGLQRSVPNGVGLFVTPGDGTAHQLVVTPDENDGQDSDLDKVFPGLHRAFSYKAIDDHGVAVAPPSGGTFSAPRGSFAGDVYQAPNDGTSGDVTVTATAGGATGTGTVRVLGAPTRLEASSTSLAFGAVGESQNVTISGVDADGFSAPIDASDLRLDFDSSKVDVAPSADGSSLAITSRSTGAVFVTASVGDARVVIQAQTGTNDTVLSDFSDSTEWIRGPTHNETQTLTTVPGAGHDGGDALQLDYDFTMHPDDPGFDPAWGHSAGIREATPRTMPAGTTSFTFWVRSSGTQAELAVTWAGVSGSATSVDPIPHLTSTDWQEVTINVPTTSAYPIHISSIQPIDGDVRDDDHFYTGTIWFSDMEYHTAVTATPPAPQAPVADRMVAANGALPSDSGAWQFGAIGDTRINDASSASAQQAMTEVQRAVQQHPDFLLLDGDIESASTATAMTNARTALQQAGCRLVPLDQTPPTAPSTDGTVPCLYLPGDLEWGTDGSAFTTEFGRGYGTFDHKGVRFVMLDSGRGGIADTVFAQYPVLQQALDTASTDASIHDVVVVAHHTLQDPSPFSSNQLSDRDDAALIEAMLSRFHSDSGKGVTMIGAHAQVADVRRDDGVPYVTLPSAGATPGGTTASGGFDGWVRFGVDPARATDENWLDADVRAFSDDTRLSAPASVAIGDDVAVSGTLEQTPTLSVPLGYPESIEWTGSDNLAIGSGQSAIDAASQAGKTAILDPATGIVHGLHLGQVTVSVRNDSLNGGQQEITGSKTIAVTTSDKANSALSITPASFADQQAGTAGTAQAVTIASIGDKPLSISDVSVTDSDGASSADFQIDASACTAGPVAVGSSCTVMVRFAPLRANVDLHATLLIHDDTPAGSHTVDLTGHSTSAPVVPTGPSTGGTPPGQPAPPAHAAGTTRVATKVATTLKAGKKDTVAVTLSTPKGTKASGTVQVKATIAVPRGKGKKGTVKRSVAVGSAKFSLTSGVHRTLQIALNKAGRTALAKAGTLRLSVVVDTRDARGHVHTASHTVVLHAAAAPKKTVAKKH